MIATILFYVLMLILAAIALVIVVSLALGCLSFLQAVLPVAKVPFQYTLRNLTVRWWTTAFTAVAFVLVIGLLTAMLAFVNGMWVLSESSGNPLNVIIMSDGATDEAFSFMTNEVDLNAIGSSIQAMIGRDEKGNFLQSKEVYVIVNQPMANAPKGGKQRRMTQVRGIADPQLSARVHGVELAEGSWWSGGGAQTVELTADGRTASWLPPGKKERLRNDVGGAPTVEKTAFEIVLGEGMARELGSDRPGKAPLKPGDVIDLGPYKWIVVGIMGGGSSTFGSELWAKDTNVGPNFGKGTNYTTLVVQAKGPAAVDPEMVKKFQTFGSVNVTAQTEKQYYAKLGETSKQFLFAIIVVAGIMAIGGVLGVMNTMFAAISQRSKDIGVLRLLGYTRWQILMSFLFESMVIAIIGGALGLLIGYLFVDGRTSISNLSSGAGGGGKTVIMKMTVAWWVVGTSVLYTLIMGSVGGLIPALSAMRLKPLESLR